MYPGTHVNFCALPGPDGLKVPNSNFSAQVYAPASAVFGDDMPVNAAFKGSENVEDWGNNFGKVVCMHYACYEKAVCRLPPPSTLPG